MRVQSKAVEEHLRMVNIIGLAILSGVLVFGGVVWYLVNVGGFEPSVQLPAYLALGANVLALVRIRHGSSGRHLDVDCMAPGRPAGRRDLGYDVHSGL